MKVELLIAALALLAAPALSTHLSTAEDEAAVGSKIPAFQATAVSLVDSQDVKVPTAYMIIGVKCGATPAYEKRFKALEDEFRSKGVDFVWVFPNKTESLESKQEWMKKLGLKGGMIDDEGGKITKALACKQTAQGILTDKEGKIVFRGGIDDNRNESAVEHRFLAEAIQATLAGKPVPVNSARAFG